MFLSSMLCKFFVNAYMHMTTHTCLPHTHVDLKLFVLAFVSTYVLYVFFSAYVNKSTYSKQFECLPFFVIRIDWVDQSI